MWFMLICLATGAGLAMLLYYRNRDNALSGKTNLLLAIVRSVAISLIAFLLLNPLVRRFIREKELPVIIVAMDNSESMLVHSRDTAADASLLKNTFNRVVKELSDDYQVETYSFGEKVKDTLQLHYHEKETDISSLFTTLENRYAGRNTGACILITDGIYNKGFNPVSLTERISFPVYTATWGDTTLKRDIVLAEVNYNRIAYLGNTFPMEIVIKANRCNGLESKLTVRNREKVFFSQPFSITGDHFSKIIQVNLQAEKEGILGYEIILEPVAGEITQANNRSRAFIEVLTSRKRILLLAARPHPDLGALYNAFLSNDMLEPVVSLLSDFRDQTGVFNLVVLHQLPEDQKSADLFFRLLQEKTPVLIIGGGKTRTDLITGAGTGPVFISGKVKGQHNEVLAALNPGFALFPPADEFTDLLSGMPPLYVPFGRYNPLPGEQSLLFQRIGSVTTSYPLISFCQLQGNRTGYIAGEGIWKWRMFSFRETKSHKPFDAFINQFVQYLTAVEDKSRFRVNASTYFHENQPVNLTAELYDAAMNPVTDPEVSLTIADTEGKSYTYTFTRKEHFYTLDAGRLPVGEYRYAATATLGGEKLKAAGRFVIVPLHIESTITRADHNMLHLLSQQTGGISIPLEAISQITGHIRDRDDIKPVSHLREKYTDLVTLFWLLGVILLLLSLEWFVRKWSGGY